MYSCTLRLAHIRGLVPATSPLSPEEFTQRDWLQGLVPEQFTRSFLRNKSRGLVAKIQTGLNSWDYSQRPTLVPATRFWSKNGQFTRWDLSPRLVAGTSRKDESPPLVCRPVTLCGLNLALAFDIHHPYNAREEWVFLYALWHPFFLSCAGIGTLFSKCAAIYSIFVVIKDGMETIKARNKRAKCV